MNHEVSVCATIRTARCVAALNVYNLKVIASDESLGLSEKNILKGVLSVDPVIHMKVQI
jgi:hypothetical protein